jgi:hypothetical protein
MVSAETSPVPLSSQFPSPLSLYTLTLNELGLYTCILPPVLVIYNIGGNLHYATQLNAPWACRTQYFKLDSSTPTI